MSEYPFQRSVAESRPPSPFDPPPIAGGYGHPGYDQSPAPWAGTPSGSARPALVLSIIAIVVAVVAALIALAAFVSLGSASDDGSASGGSDEPYVLYGTLPRVVPDQPYASGAIVQEVEWTLDKDDSTYSDVTCASLEAVTIGATVVCHGTVDDLPTMMTIRIEDPNGHYSLTEDF